MKPRYLRIRWLKGLSYIRVKSMPNFKIFVDRNLACCKLQMEILCDLARWEFQSLVPISKLALPAECMGRRGQTWLSTSSKFPSELVKQHSREALFTETDQANLHRYIFEKMTPSKRALGRSLRRESKDSLSKRKLAVPCGLPPETFQWDKMWRRKTMILMILTSWVLGIISFYGLIFNKICKSKKLKI